MRAQAARFVGRGDHLRLLDDAVRAAAAGEPQLVVCGGDAGVGKTRLMEHFAARQAAGGARVLRGACVELSAEGLPLAPITSALRELIDEIGLPGLAALLPGHQGLTRLLPEMGAPEPPPGAPRALPLDLFAILLERLAAERPVILVIDDLHWADRSTRDLLGFVARTGRTGRVVTITSYRAQELGRGHPLRPFLAELERLQGVHRIALRPFSRAETAELIAGLVPDPPSGALVDRIFRLSGGNAYFVQELVHAGPDDGTLPESLRDLLLDRVERLPETARRVVRLAAVGGDRITHRLLAETAGLPEAQLLTALRAATDAQVLRPAGADGYEFQHALLREVLAADLLPVERVRLHLAFARALDADPDLVPPDRAAAEAAFHWYGAREPALALPALLRAATAAEAVYAHAEQFRMLERALELWPEVTGVDRLDLWEKAIAAAGWAGEDIQALELIDQALGELDQLAEPERAAMLLAQRSRALLALGSDQALDALNEALRILPAAPTAARCQVLDLLGAVQLSRRNPAEARDAAQESVRIAVELGDTEREANAGVTLGAALLQLGSYGEGFAVLERARLLASSRGDAVRLTRVFLNQAQAYSDLGLHRAAADAARTGLDSAQTAGLARTLGGLLRVLLASSVGVLGSWDEAESIASAGLELDPPAAVGAALYSLRGEIALARGDLATAREHHSLARKLLDQTENVARSMTLPTECLAAEIALRENRVSEAREIVLRSLEEVGERSAASLAWPLVIIGARTEAVGRLRARLPGAPSAPSDLAGPLRAAAASLGARTTQSAAYTLHFEAELGSGSWPEVAAAWDSLDAPYRSAQARLRAASALASSGDRESARTWLAAAVATAERLGAEALLEEAGHIARRERLELDPAAPEPGDAEQLGLTKREIEVLRLIVAGHSNRQIAQELFISAKTVSVHVTHILTKLGATSRGEAAALTHTLHLLTDPP